MADTAKICNEKSEITSKKNGSRFKRMDPLSSLVSLPLKPPLSSLSHQLASAIVAGGRLLPDIFYIPFFCMSRRSVAPSSQLGNMVTLTIYSGFVFFPSLTYMSIYLLTYIYIFTYIYVYLSVYLFIYL